MHKKPHETKQYFETDCPYEDNTGGSTAGPIQFCCAVSEKSKCPNLLNKNIMAAGTAIL